MGAYLSEPITDKESTDEIGDRVICGASSMQGWRKTQEDAHNCTLDYDTNASLFAVYDGHGGHEVAVYSAQHLPKYLKKCEAYKEGDYTQALKDAFLEFDAALIKPEVLTILKQLATNKNDDDNSGSAEDEEEENVKNLYEEAEMPLEQVMAKYQNDLLNSKNKGNDDDDKSLVPSFLLDRHSCSSGASSSRAGSSSSKCDSSHISEPGNKSSDSEEGSVVKKEEDEASESSSEGQSSSKQVESSTSNGDSKPVETVKTEKNVESGDENIVDKISGKSEAIKAKKEKSGDEKISDKAKDIKVKKEKSGDENSLGVEVNGEIGDEEKKGVNGEVAESEGGKGKEKARISSSLRRRCATALYRSLLESQDTSDSDSDDEGDESFQGAENSSDEDDEDEDGDEEEENENGDEEGEDENEEEEEENNMLDDEEDEDDFSMYISDKPGLDSGCTAVVALLKGQELYVANAGDSRCVVCRKGQAIEMSLDHKPEDDIERTRIVKAGGRITGDGRVNGGLNLSRALGDHAYKQSEGLPAEEQMITALPDVRTLMIDPAEDEFMVLACDGIWNFMSSQEVVDFVREHIQKGETKLSKICEELFDHCLAPKTFGDGTGCDNMTAVIVQFRPELANSSDTKSVKRAASPTECDSTKRPRTEESGSV